MQKISALILSFVFANMVTAQDPCASLNYHAFKAESLAGAYTDLGTLGIEISVSNLDDGISAPQEIGFDFEYHCQHFSQFIFNTNGFIKLGTETTPKTNLFFSNAQSTTGGLFNDTDSNNVNLIVVFNHDIETVNPDPDFRVNTSGTAPYRVCTIQWKNMQEWSADPATKQYIDMDFQLKLHETTNVIEFVFGDWEPSTNPSNFKTAACGLKGKSAEDDQLLVVVKNSAAFWDNITFQNGNYAPNEAFNFGNPTDRPRPDIGRTYRFTPTNENDLSVRQVYALGDASMYYSSPQNISADIQNAGFETKSGIPVVLEISGANTYRDTQYISQLAFLENARITFSGFTPESNGLTSLRITVGEDDSSVDNTINQTQWVTDLEINHSVEGTASRGYGFLSGVQGIYYVKYPVHGTASVNTVNVFLANDSPSIGRTVFAAVLNANGTLVARSENYVIQENDLGRWHTFPFAIPPILSDTEFYAGFGMTSSLMEFSPLGVQDEAPVRPGTFYSSLVTGSGLKAMDTLTFSYRFMIGATLAGTPPHAGLASGDTTFCVDGIARLRMEDYTGFISWQQSPDGLEDWSNVSMGTGANSPIYETSALDSSTFYRAKVTQPGFEAMYSNVLYVEVIPENPFIISSGDVLQSSVSEGNQWYDENGLIPGATGQLFIASVPGTYYVIVTSGECTAHPSNSIEILSVGISETSSFSLIKIFPNPVRDELNIDMDGNTELIPFEIVNMMGHVMYRGEMEEKLRIGMIMFSKGVYFIRFNHGTVMKFVKA